MLVFVSDYINNHFYILWCYFLCITQKKPIPVLLITKEWGRCPNKYSEI